MREGEQVSDADSYGRKEGGMIVLCIKATKVDRMNEVSLYAPAGSTGDSRGARSRVGMGEAVGQDRRVVVRCVFV